MAKKSFAAYAACRYFFKDQNWTKSSLDQEAHPEVYSPYFQDPGVPLHIVLRTKSDPMSYEQALRRIVSEQDKEMPVSTVATFEQLMGESLAPRRIATIMLGIYSAMCAPTIKFQTEASLNC